MIKKYTIDWNGFKAVFALDHSLITNERLSEIATLLEEEKNKPSGEVEDLTITVLKQLADICFLYRGNFNLFDLIKEFDWEDDGGFDGWPKIDGSEGILLISVDRIKVSPADMTVETEIIDKLPDPPKIPKCPGSDEMKG